MLDRRLPPLNALRAFEAAARAKMAGNKNASTMNFHLTSRDVARQLGSPTLTGSARI